MRLPGTSFQGWVHLHTQCTPVLHCASVSPSAPGGSQARDEGPKWARASASAKMQAAPWLSRLELLTPAPPASCLAFLADPSPLQSHRAGQG